MKVNTSTVALDRLVKIVPHDLTRDISLHETAAFGISKAAGDTRFETFVTPVTESGEFAAPGNGTRACNGTQAWLALPTGHLGDAPHLYHPAYVMALVSSEDFCSVNGGSEEALSAALIPAISFMTEEWTRRSMTLNGMRMSTEFFATGSLRVIDLVRQRLEAGQRDVVHDVLVYLMRQILQERLLADEERALRAESLAAYLAVEPHRVLELMKGTKLEDQQIVSALANGFAGPVKRQVDITPLVTNQLQLLRSELQIFSLREQNVLNLIDPIVSLLYADGTTPNG